MPDTPIHQRARALLAAWRAELHRSYVVHGAPGVVYADADVARDIAELDEVIAALSQGAPEGRAVAPATEPPNAWRDHGAAIDAKALATATEISLMWGQDRSQFVSRIQVAVRDAIDWVRFARWGNNPPPIATQPAPSRDSQDAFPALHALTEAILTRADNDYMARQIDAAVKVMASRGWATPVPWPDPEFFATRTAPGRDSTPQASSNSGAEGQQAKGQSMWTMAAESKLLPHLGPQQAARSEAPAGWQLVPIEPTEEMHAAAVRTIQRCTGNADFPPRVWRAMLSASPPSAQPAEKPYQMPFGSDCDQRMAEARWAAEKGKPE